MVNWNQLKLSIVIVFVTLIGFLIYANLLIEGHPNEASLRILVSVSLVVAMLSYALSSYTSGEVVEELEKIREELEAIRRK